MGNPFTLAVIVPIRAFKIPLCPLAKILGGEVILLLLKEENYMKKPLEGNIPGMTEFQGMKTSFFLLQLNYLSLVFEIKEEKN